MPPALHQRVFQMIEMVPQRHWIQILEYAIKTSCSASKLTQLKHAASKAWSALMRMRARMTFAATNNRRDLLSLETEMEVQEITREDFEQAMVGRSTI